MSKIETIFVDLYLAPGEEKNTEIFIRYNLSDIFFLNYLIIYSFSSMELSVLGFVYFFFFKFSQVFF